jgi:N-glycosylase/DNA lyase
MQEFTYLKGDKELTISLPDPDTWILGQVSWGNPCALFTPAYWYTQYIMRGPDLRPTRHRIGQTFAEEVAACLLGGHGIPAEICNAAFERVKRHGLIAQLCDDTASFEEVLCEPLEIGNRWVRYRFWRQKSRYLAAAFRQLKSTDIFFDDAVEVRNRLVAFQGIGPKTASWIVRNWMDSDAVAILDIHIVRAGQLMNLFRQSERVERHYLQMEEKFVMLASKLAVPTSDLDALIWAMMRTTPHIVARMLSELRPRALNVRYLQVGRARTQAP